MEEEYYTLSADGGGSKLNVIVFDDTFHFRAAGYGGPVNGSFPEDEKRRQIEAALADCLSAVPPGRIKRVFLSAPWMGSREEAVRDHAFFHTVKKHSPQAGCCPLSEGEACLLAGGFRREGTVVLSGTGSGIFMVGNKEAHLGGWGYLLGDFGSGFSIGQKGLQAAIRGEEKWGKQTCLGELARQAYGVEKLWDLLPFVYQNPFAVKQVASFCRWVGMAADDGDEAALGILKEAAWELCCQTTVLLKEYIQEDPYVLVSGGAWKAGRFLFRSFSEQMKERFPAVRIHKPVFEPVMGGVVLALLEKKADPAAGLKELQKEFPQFLIGNVEEVKKNVNGKV